MAGLQEYAVMKFDYLKGQYEKNNIVTEGINITHCHFIIYSIVSLLNINIQPFTTVSLGS